MRTFKWISYICALTLCFSGCSLTPASIYDEVAPYAYHDADKYSDLFRNNLQYLRLDAAFQSAYGQIFTAVYDNVYTEVLIQENGEERPGIRIPLDQAQLSGDDMAQLFEAFFHDNPQFFFLDRTYSVEGSENDGKTTYDTVILRFTHNYKERTLAVQQLDAVVEEILAACPTTTDEYEKELYLHDQLIDRCRYDDVAAMHSSAEYANAYSAYGALVEGKAVCEGYAKAIQLLLNKANITNTVVLGNARSDQEAHMWNLVQINGAYYYLDPTWNDDETTPHYSYFNISAAMLEKTHILDDQLVTVDCVDVNDNYHMRSNTFIDTYERDAIAAAIATNINQGKAAVHLRFAEGKFENALLFLKNSTLTYNKVTPYLAEGKQLWEYELFTHKGQNTITLYKSS